MTRRTRTQIAEDTARQIAQSEWFHARFFKAPTPECPHCEGTGTIVHEEEEFFIEHNCSCIERTAEERAEWKLPTLNPNL